MAQAYGKLQKKEPKLEPGLHSETLWTQTGSGKCRHFLRLSLRRCDGLNMLGPSEVSLLRGVALLEEFSLFRGSVTLREEVGIEVSSYAQAQCGIRVSFCFPRIKMKNSQLLPHLLPAGCRDSHHDDNGLNSGTVSQPPFSDFIRKSRLGHGVSSQQ